MAWIEYNNNPVGRKVGDCSVRAIAKALGIDWETAYVNLTMNGFVMGDMPSADSVWGSVLRQNGFYRRSIPDTCPDCYTAADFCRDHPSGSTTPSAEDIQVTKRLKQCGDLLGISMLDHIIIGGESGDTFSFAAEGLMPDD